MRVKKTVTTMMLIACVLLGMLFTACGQEEVNSMEGENVTETMENENVQTVTFIDDLGREVSVKNPQRVAALLGSYAHIWHL